MIDVDCSETLVRQTNRRQKFGNRLLAHKHLTGAKMFIAHIFLPMDEHFLKIFLNNVLSWFSDCLFELDAITV